MFNTLQNNSFPSPAPSPMDIQNGVDGNHISDTLGLPAASPMEPDELRSTLERELLKLSQDLYEMEVCAGEVGAGREESVPEYLWRINQSFQTLSNLSTQMTDSVPRQVVENVDQFKNPHNYTKNALSRATGENQYALGRVLGLESFRRQLHSAVSQAFPTIPLPPRRHQPVTSKPRESGGEKDDKKNQALIADDDVGHVEHAPEVVGEGDDDDDMEEVKVEFDGRGLHETSRPDRQVAVAQEPGGAKSAPDNRGLPNGIQYSPDIP